MSVLKSAFADQNFPLPAGDKLLKFLRKEYTPSLVKDEIRLSLEQNKCSKIYTEKLYILCLDGTIELHTRQSAVTEIEKEIQAEDSKWTTFNENKILKTSRYQS